MEKSTKGVKKYTDLPIEAKNYLKEIEKLAGKNQICFNRRRKNRDYKNVILTLIISMYIVQKNMSPLEQDSRERPVIPNVLADRYASTPIVINWSPENKVRQERNLWIVIMQGQKDLGLHIPQSHIDAYKSVKDHVDLESIRKRELELQHDEKARIDEFNALAGFEDIHKGLTSRDVSDNLEQMQIRDSLIIIRDRTVATLARDARLAVDYDNLVYAGRTHNAPAQP